MNRINDYRIATPEQADKFMAEIAKIETTIELEKARANSKIATIKNSLTTRLADLETELNPIAAALRRFIDANRAIFKRPRKRKTQAGSYGLQDVEEIVIDDEDTLCEFLFEAGYTDCVKVVRTPVKAALKERLKAGEILPGVYLKTGATAVYKVDPSLLKDAKERGQL